jgi:hypothetical protein
MWNEATEVHDRAPTEELQCAGEARDRFSAQSEFVDVSPWEK